MILKGAQATSERIAETFRYKQRRNEGREDICHIYRVWLGLYRHLGITISSLEMI